MNNNYKKIAVVFYSVTALYWFSLYSYGSVLSNHAAKMGADAAMIGLIAGSYGLAQMVLRIPVGIFSDIIKNRKLFIGVGLVFSCISSIGLGLAETPGQLLLFRSFAGIAVSTWVVFPGYITETLIGTDTHELMGKLSAINKSGRMIALLAGGFAAQLFGGQWAFLIGGIVAALSLILWTALPADSYHSDHKKHSVKEFLSVIKDRDLFITSILITFFQFAVFAATYTFTPVLAKNIGMNEVFIGVLTALFTMAGIASALLSGTFFKKHLGPKRTVTMAFLASGFIFMAMPFVQTAILLFLLQVAVGFFMGMILPILMAQSMKNIPKEKKGSAMGYFQAIYGIGVLAGPYIMGLIINYGNIKLGYSVVLAICIIAAMATYSYGRRDRKNGLEKY